MTTNGLPVNPRTYSATASVSDRPVGRQAFVGQNRATGMLGPFGHFPAMALWSALSLLLIAAADTGGRQSTTWAEPVFWTALVALFAPIAWRLFASEPSRHERIALLLLLGMTLLLVKLLHSPLEYTFSDEFVHWRSTHDVSELRHLFERNSLLPIASLFPGLALITSSLAGFGSLSIYDAGVIVVAAGRVMLVLSLFLLYEQASRSHRVAGIATLMYSANPNFIFFDSQFAYETMALPFVVFTLMLVARLYRAGQAERLGLTACAVGGVLITVVMHHISSYALVAYLSTWALFEWAHKWKWLKALLGSLLTSRWGAGARSRLDRWLTAVGFSGLAEPKFCKIRGFQPGVGGLAIMAIMASIAWAVYVANFAVVGYITPHLAKGLNELMRMIAGEAGGRQLFQTFSGQMAPPLERLVAYASVALILLIGSIGGVRVGRKQWEQVVALVLIAGSIGYPISLALRLTQSGAESSNRAAEFVFLGIAYLLANGFLWIETRLLPLGWAKFASVLIATLVFAGGLVVGWAPWARLPGPYLVTADPRSVELESEVAARWALTYLGPGNRITTDRSNRHRMGSIGEQYTVTGYGDGVEISEVFFALVVGPDEMDQLRQTRVRYLITDKRITTGLPMTGEYFEKGEPGTLQHTTPFDIAAILKFDSVPEFDRIYDSGNIVFYDVGAVSGAK